MVDDRIGALMRPISRTRFDSFAAFARQSVPTGLLAEVAWFEGVSSKILAALVLDSDGEYRAVVLQPGLESRYTHAGMTDSCSTPEGALNKLHATVEALISETDVGPVQSVVRDAATDLFSPVVAPDRFHPGFHHLLLESSYSSAREIITVMMPWFDDVDNSFVKEFQTQFDARLWELYLFAALRESGLRVERPASTSVSMPDFLVEGSSGAFVVEATSANPPRKGGMRRLLSALGGGRIRPTTLRTIYPLDGPARWVRSSKSSTGRRHRLGVSLWSSPSKIFMTQNPHP